MFYYVSCNTRGQGDGSKENPFRTIQQAADIAKAGDEIVIASGLYREHVDPKHSGTKEKPIVYWADGKCIISGAEPVKSWINLSKNLWLAKIPNGIFNDYNPYTTVISGDWYYTEAPLHTGEVYLNGKSMYETDCLDSVENPREHLPSEDREFSVYRWYTCQENGHTLLYANFHGLNPNEENVEINVRRNCFYPQKPGRSYITVSGFTIRQAATTWAPPTAYQEGMVGPHWSKGWIIQDCEIHDSKCAGISIGKYLQPNNENKWSLKRLKQGTQTERDSICQAQMEGWSKDTIGSHIIRRCNIYNCEQAGIVGHLGCAFSFIEDNHIHHINNKRQLNGAEIAGVKLHAAIDVIFAGNHIHHCTRGLWLDWQAQGTCISRNLFHDNFPKKEDGPFALPLDIGEDLFIEVSHGPTLVDHNILMSPQACRFSTQGTAFVHNLICGSFTSVGEGTNNIGGVETIAGTGDDIVDPGARYTPYHVPHRTEIAGFMTILHGDNRFYNNLFVQNEEAGTYNSLYEPISIKPLNSVVGTIPFDNYPTEQEYMDKFFKALDKGAMEDRSKYYSKLPVYTGGNIFFNGANPCKKEKNYAVVKEIVKVELKIVDEKYYLDTNIYENMPYLDTPFISTEYLGEAFESEQKFENPDGTPIVFKHDYFGNERKINPMPGPFETEESWKMSLL